MPSSIFHPLGPFSHCTPRLLPISDAPKPSPSTGVTGICHARGSNAALPPVWLVYFNVADVAASIRECTARGGEVLHGPRDLCGKDFSVIRDPAGAVCALIGPAREG